jgi:ferredoxin
MHIHVDPIKCEAHGLCAELLPERITLDEWGYPLVDQTPIPPALDDLARRAVNACPTLALRLQASQTADRDPGAPRPADRSVAAGGSGTRDRPYQLYTPRGRRR